VPAGADHWENVYASAPTTQLSWFTPEHAVSLRLIEDAVSSRAAAVIDVGAGASRLVDRLLERGFLDVSVLDISQQALHEVRQRLGQRAADITFIHRDLVTWEADRQYDVWHDRAVFHFFTENAARDRYVKIAARAIRAGGSLVLATFADDGPTQCSGLAVSRYAAQELEAVFGAHFSLAEKDREKHLTPWGSVQYFTWAQFQRNPDT